MEPNINHFLFSMQPKENVNHEEFESRCVVRRSDNAWMNKELITIWVNDVLGTFLFNKWLLAWDSYECHMIESVRKDMKEMNIDSLIIQGGCTKYIQASDVRWNKPFKVRMTELFDQCLEKVSINLLKMVIWNPLPGKE